MAKKLALGVDDFKKIIEGDYALVDKTLFIKEFFENGAEITLTPRPRRFGKTLNLSMLRYFCEKTEQSYRYLFDNLKVSHHPDIMAHQGQYPVIFLTFKDIKVPTWEECYGKLKKIIALEFERHSYLLDSDVLMAHTKIEFRAVMEQTATSIEYQDALKNLSEYLFKYHQKQVIILIDEYDTPIHEAVMCDSHKKPTEKAYYTNAIYFIRNFMCAGLKGNVNLHKGFMTGILQIARESIFSGMNNLAVCSLTNKEHFSDQFGFLENEVIQLCKQVDNDTPITAIKEWYNGYGSGRHFVYNPWSIINYLFNKEFKPFWINTSDNKLPRSLVAKASAEIKSEIQQLGNGGMIRKNINESISFIDMETEENIVWSFLLFTGYLTFVVPEKQTNASDFYLIVPNREVKDFFKTIETAWFDTKHMQKILSPLLLALATGNIGEFKARFEDISMRCFSYMDVTENEAENFYHAFVLGMIIGLDSTHEIKSNRESGSGRYDVMIVPRDNKDIGIIMEFKKRRPKEEENLEESAINALEQIEDKKYEVELRERGVTMIKKLAIVFDGKESLVKEG